jgi:hypothetical protein
MTMKLCMRKLALAALLAGVPGIAFAAADTDWQARVGEALGKTGSEALGGIYHVGLPRIDLSGAGSRRNGTSIRAWVLSGSGVAAVRRCS